MEAVICHIRDKESCSYRSPSGVHGVAASAVEYGFRFA
jgi:hypothetical protein